MFLKTKIKIFSIIRNQELEINPFSLSFIGKNIHFEEMYLDDYYKKSVSHVKFSSLLAAFMCLGFGILAKQIIPQINIYFWNYLIIGSCFSLLCVFFLSFTKIYRYIYQITTYFVATLAGTTVLILNILTISLGDIYYKGIALVILFIYTLSRARFIWSTMAGWTLILLYEIIAIFILDIPMQLIINDTFFFMSANIIGMSARYAIEYYSRKDFILAKLLEEEQIKVEEINKKLEKKVKERTIQLESSEKEYRDLVENARSIILKWDKKGKITFLNKYAQELFQFKEREILGKNVVGTIVPKMETSGKDLVKMIIGITKDPEKYALNENENIKKNGERVWISWSNRPVFKGEKLVGVLSIGHDTTEIKRARDKLEESYEKLKELDKMKNEFISIASHELRTPMSVIKGYVSLFLDGAVGKINAKQKVFLGRIINNTDRLIQLVNDMLDLSKLEAGKVEFKIVKIKILNFINNIVSELEVMYKEKNIELTINNKINNDIEILSDLDKLSQVFINLLGNSYKYTSKKGKVIVSLDIFEKKDGFIKISIIDNGIGIEKGQEEIIFNKFSQIDNYLQRDYEGTGLGLPIVKEIIEKLGGEIWVDTSVKEGACFEFTLKIA